MGPVIKKSHQPLNQLGGALSQEIHHHYNKTVLIQSKVLQINSLTLESAQHKPEQPSLDAASKLFRI